MHQLTINFSGAIVDQQSFLDGARTYAIELEDQPSVGWRMTLSFRWAVERERVSEGDLTLVDPVGAELYGVLRQGTASELTDGDGNVNAAQLDLAFDISGGEGGYADASGEVRVAGTLAGQGEGTGGSMEGAPLEGALLTARIAVEGAREGEVWSRPPETSIPTGTPQRYQEPRGA